LENNLKKTSLRVIGAGKEGLGDQKTRWPAGCRWKKKKGGVTPPHIEKGLDG